MSDTNALGTAYWSAAYDDVMIRSRELPNRLMAFHMPSQTSNLRAAVFSCVANAGGVLFAGGADQLDYVGSTG